MANMMTDQAIRRLYSNPLFISESSDDRTPDKNVGTVKKVSDSENLDPICIEPTDSQRSSLSITPPKLYTPTFLTPRSSLTSDTYNDSIAATEFYSFSIDSDELSQSIANNTVNSLYETCVETSVRLLSATRSVRRRLRPLVNSEFLLNRLPKLQRLSVGGRTSPRQSDQFNKSEHCTCEEGHFDGNCLKSFMEMSVQPAEYRNTTQMMTSTPVITKDVYDHGIFNVARIKKVELHDLSPKVPEFHVIDATPKDRCINNNNVRIPNGNHYGNQTNVFATNVVAPTTQNYTKDQNQSTQHSMTMPAPEDGNVLKKVISFTLDQMYSGDSATEKEKRPSFVPEKLHFSTYEQFKGQLFVKWVSNSIASSRKFESKDINLKAIEMLISEVCTHLIAAGVMKQIIDYDEKTKDVFCPNEMYQWTHVELARQQQNGPKKDVHSLHQYDEETIKYVNESTMTLTSDGHEESFASIKTKRLSCELSLENNHINSENDEQQFKIESTNSCGIENLEEHLVEIQSKGNFDHHLENDQPTKCDCDSNMGKIRVEISTQTDDIVDTTNDEKESHIALSDNTENGLECDLEPSNPTPPLPPPPPSFTVTFPSPTIAPPPPPPPPFAFNSLAPPTSHIQSTTQSSPSKTTTILTSASSFCPPPPPPMNGLHGPPPLPLPTGNMWFKSDTLRKAAKVPPKPMINLFWTRILIPKEDEEEEKIKEPESNEFSTIKKREKLWQKIDETHLDNAEDFTELFARQATPKRPREVSKVPKRAVIKVLDLKRSQSVGIFSQSLYRHRIDSQAIQRAIYNWDLSNIGLDLLQQLLEHRATQAELVAIKEAQKNTTLSMPLDGPENFLLKFSEINSAPERIACIIFRNEFEELNTQIEQKIKTIRNLCEFLTENSHLGDLFAIILTLGNVMNGGNRYRGQADGFGLDVLNKLKDVKSKDKKTTLLHFIVKTFICKRRQDGQKPKEIAYPLPDSDSMKSASTVDFDMLYDQIEQLRKNFEDIKEKINNVISSSTEQNIQPFKDISEELVRNATSKIDNQYHELKICKVIFRETLDYFKHIPKTGTIDECTPSQFFELWVNFCIDFRDLWRKEMAAINAEIIQKYKSIASPKTPQSRAKGKQKPIGLRVRRVNQL